MRPARSAPTPSSLAALASIAPDTECWNRSEINPQVNQPCLVAQRFTVAVTDAGSFSQRGSRNHRQTQTQPQSQLPRHGQSKSAWHACTARTTYPPIEPLVRREGRRLQRGQRSTAKVRTDVPASLLRAVSLSRPAESSNDTKVQTATHYRHSANSKRDLTHPQTQEQYPCGSIRGRREEFDDLFLTVHFREVHRHILRPIPEVS